MSAQQEAISKGMKSHWKRRKALQERTRTGKFQYVPYSKIETYHRAGWMVTATLGPVHGRYSVLMWRCDCD